MPVQLVVCSVESQPFPLAKRAILLVWATPLQIPLALELGERFGTLTPGEEPGMRFRGISTLILSTGDRPFKAGGRVVTKTLPEMLLCFTRGKVGSACRSRLEAAVYFSWEFDEGEEVAGVHPELPLLGVGKEAGLSVLCVPASGQVGHRSAALERLAADFDKAERILVGDVAPGWNEPSHLCTAPESLEAGGGVIEGETLTIADFWA